MTTTRKLETLASRIADLTEQLSVPAEDLAWTADECDDAARQAARDLAALERAAAKLAELARERTATLTAELEARAAELEAEAEAEAA